MTQEEVKAKAAAIKEAEKLLTRARITLQFECKHVALTYKYGSSTGNYDPGSDIYWITWHCADCGKHWQTDQKREEHVKYPHAKNATRS